MLLFQWLLFSTHCLRPYFVSVCALLVFVRCVFTLRASLACRVIDQTFTFPSAILFHFLCLVLSFELYRFAAEILNESHESMFYEEYSVDCVRILVSSFFRFFYRPLILFALCSFENCEAPSRDWP